MSLPKMKYEFEGRNTANFVSKAQAKRDTNISYLGEINNSPKIAKNGKVSNQYTYILYLMPSDFSGYQVCGGATTECILGCLNMSGYNICDVKQIIQNARNNRTKLFFEQRNLFLDWLIAEIKTAQNKAIKDNYGFSVRLNGTSDINWNAYKHNGKTIFEHFSDVQFYDYTKVGNRFDKLPKNYDLTLSYTGYNWEDCFNVLLNDNNVAVIFNIKKDMPLPTTYNGFEVIDGDLTDYRPDDKKGCIVGLRWKKIKNKVHNEQIRNSVFVVQQDEIDRQ